MARLFNSLTCLQTPFPASRCCFPPTPVPSPHSRADPLTFAAMGQTTSGVVNPILYSSQAFAPLAVWASGVSSLPACRWCGVPARMLSARATQPSKDLCWKHLPTRQRTRLVRRNENVLKMVSAWRLTSGEKRKGTSDAAPPSHDCSQQTCQSA